MASTRRGQARHQIPADAALSGILALLVDEREERLKGVLTGAKIELLLWDAGLAVDDIAAVTGKNEGAVRKSIERAGKK